MWMARRHPERDHLGEYWNAVNRGAPPEELARLAAPLDPRMLAAIDRARALHRRRRPDPAFASQLERTLMNALATAPAGTIPLGPTRSGQFNGRTFPPARSNWLPSLPETGRRTRWLVAQAATVALIVLAIVGGFLVFNNNDRPAVSPPLAPSATPLATDAADVPMYRGNAARTGEMAGPGPMAEPSELWRVQTQGEVHSAPAIVDGSLYVGSGDDHLYARDAASGDEIWRFQTGGSVGSSPAVVDGIVYVGSADENLYAIDAATGTEVWRAPAAENTAPAVVDGVVYAGGVDGAIVAFDAATGAEVWRSVLAASASRSVGVGAGFVYVGTSDGVFHALDVASGEERWTLETGAEQVVTPTVADGTVYIVARAGDGSEAVMIAADAAGGEERWRYATPSGRGMTPVAVTGGLVVIGTFDGDVAAVDVESGEERWYYDTGSEDGLNSAVGVTSDTVFAAGLDGNLHAIDLETGFERWRYAVGAGIDFGPVVSGGVLYVGAFDGVIYAFGDSGAASSLSLPATSDDSTPGASPAATPASGATPAVAASVSAESLAEFVWSASGGPEGLAEPCDIAFAPDGRIWVNDGSGRFHIFEPDGTFVEAWGDPGSGEGQFDFKDPDGNVYGGIAFTPDGGLIVADTGNRRVQRFDADRAYIWAWGGFGGELDLFGIPLTITAGPDGAFYVLDERPDRVLVFDPDGTLLRSFAVHADAAVSNEVNDLFVGTDGTVYVASTAPQAVLTFDPSGQPLATIGEDRFNDQVAAVTADNAGRIYATEAPTGDRVLVFEMDGTYIGSWGTSGAGEGQFVFPTIVALDGTGHAYVTDIGLNTLQKFRLTPPLGPEV